MVKDLFGFEVAQIEPTTRAELTAEYVRSILHYDPVTGIWRWREIIGTRNLYAGQRAGSINQDTGYRNIRISNIACVSARLIWLYMTGEWPPNEVDHINTDKSDDMWDNLRLANHTQQRWNTNVTSRNTSGYKCVYPQKRDGRWYATITIDGKRVFLGSFSTKERASIAYINAAIRYQGEFARAQQSPKKELF
jgi:hypothetical protein